MFSIIIPTFNNIKYLKLCLESIKKNSTFNHEIIVHVNLGEDGTKEFLNGGNDFTVNIALISKGLPEELLEKAKEKFIQIQQAYEEIEKQRK